MLALLRRHHLDPVRVLHQRPFVSGVSGLAARFALTLLALRTAVSLLACQSIGGGRLGGGGRVPLPHCKLPLQFGDLPLQFGDLLIPFDYLLAQFLNLSLLPFDFPPQLFPAWRLCGRMPTACFRFVACALSGSPSHPPYVKRFRGICPDNSTGSSRREPQNQGGEQLPNLTLELNGKMITDTAIAPLWFDYCPFRRSRSLIPI